MSQHPRRSPRCQVNPVAHPKAVYCLDCRPCHRRPPPPCRRCGSSDDYTSGLCIRCHKYAPALPSSCPHCWSWGRFKHSGGICLACKDWRARNHLTSALPACGHFGERYDSLREVTRDDVLRVLPSGATHRKNVLFGLRSIFRVLKGRKLTLINPTAGIRSSRLSGRTPLPVQVKRAAPSTTQTSTRSPSWTALVAAREVCDTAGYVHLDDAHNTLLPGPIATVWAAAGTRLEEGGGQ